MFEKITIIGCGLIGSSILRNINNNKICKAVSVFDKSNWDSYQKVNDKFFRVDLGRTRPSVMEVSP